MKIKETNLTSATYRWIEGINKAVPCVSEDDIHIHETDELKGFLDTLDAFIDDENVTTIVIEKTDGTVKQFEKVRNMKSIHTVNVIETTGRLKCWPIRAFPETPEGNQAAEKLFLRICHETAVDTSDEALARYLKDGICEVGDGSVLLVHST